MRGPKGNKKSLLVLLCFALIVSWGSIYSPSNASAASSALLPMGQPVEQVVGGTEVVFDGDDEGLSDAISIGFDFYFYGKKFDHVYAATNGYLMFEDPVIDYESYESLPLEKLDHYIAPYFADYELLPISKVLYKTVGEVGQRKFVIQYTNMAFYGAPTPVGTFQVILYEENSEIQFQYPQLVGYEYFENAFGTNALIGIQGPTGVEPRNVTYSQRTKSVTEKQAIRFTPSDPNEYELVSNIDNEFAAYDERAVYESILLSIDAFPTNPMAVNPVDGSYTASKHTFQWSAAIGATSYRLLIAEDANFENIVQDESGIGQTSFDMEGLEMGMTYYWKVTAVNDAGYLTYSNTYRFKVLLDRALPLNQPVETQVQGTEVKFTNSTKVVQLPFAFNIHNNQYSKVEISEDGYLRINNDDYKSEIVQSLYKSDGKVLYATLGEAPNRKFVIQYTNGVLDDESFGTFQVIFYESDESIQFQYPLLLAFDERYSTSHLSLQSSETNNDDWQWQSSYSGRVAEKQAIRFSPNGPTSYVVTKKADYDPVLLIPAGFPAPSKLVSPADGSSSSTNVKFKWENTKGVIYNILYLATDSSFTFDSLVVDPGKTISGTSHTVNGLEEGLVYYWKVLAMNSKGFTISNTYQFTVPFTNPPTTVATDHVSSITSMTATAGGNVTANGAATVAERGIVYSLNANPTINDTKVAATIGGAGAFTVGLVGLQSNTTYHARAYAIIEGTINYGEEVTFTTLGSSASLSALSLRGITLDQVVSGNVYSYTSSVPNTVSSTAVTATVQDAVYRSMTANVYNSGNIIVLGPIDLASGAMSSEIPLDVGANKIEIVVLALDGSETTYTVNVTRAAPSGNQSVTVNTNTTVNAITSMTATVGGSVITDGIATVAERGIVYSLNADPTYNDAKVLAANGGSGAFTVDLVGLQSNKTYHARAYALSVGNIFYGQDVTFTTLDPHGSSASLSALSLRGITLEQVVSGNVYSYTASVPNTVSSTAVTATVQDAVYRSMTANVYNSGNIIVLGPIDLASGVMSSEIPLQVGSNKIEIVVLALDGSETTYTVNVTRAAPSGNQSVTVNTDTTVNAITSVTATVGGSVITDGIATIAERGIVYSLNANPTIYDTTVAAAIGGVGAFTVDLVGLQSNKTYYARAYAISESNIFYGQDVTFTTLDSHGSSATLSGLSLREITLDQLMSGSVYSYTASVPNTVSSTAVTATVQDADYRSVTANVYNSSDILVLGPIDLASGVMSSEIPLHVGSNKIKIVVLALDGSETTYTVTITRATAQTTPPPGGGGAPSVVTSKDGKLSLPIDRAGEVSLNNEIEITIPANATKKQLELTIEKVLSTQGLLGSKEILASSVFEVLKNFTEKFDKMVTITMLFDPSKLKSGQTVAIFYYDEVKKAWVKVEGGKISKNRISVEVNHFTKFAVLVVDEKTGLPVLEQSTDTKTDPATEFKLSDITKHWAEASIKQAVISGIVKGYTDGTFKPNATVTRAEFAVMLMNALKPQGNGAELKFTDNAKIGTWAQKAVAQAVQAGIIKGNQDGSFRPNAEVTRAEMAVMIANALGQPIETNVTTSFADDKDIPAWAKGSVAIVKQAGIVQGNSDNKYAPQNNATRAEAVTVLLKMLAHKNK
ncbi:S-layer homology domain-containing protein [Cohnella sp. WQ 127256]|uniref:S-layer homology domain-containing protein n=1 Tax=Cohnella sp. WQ 127256 TaxID=2938790 RepID=UPI0021188694|nr:S-layer homology domain-containing protein [Cohnella sp. WQ 127256]